MKPNIRWGILGTGLIADIFSACLNEAPQAKLIAVGSRDVQRAKEFGQRHNIPNCHGSYKDLAADPDVDVVYVASPNPWHLEHSLLCMDQGKAVLCEKPFTMNAAEAEEMIRKAREKKVFLMEAMWTRFLPAMGRLRTMLADGVIGDVRLIEGRHGFRVNADLEKKWLTPEVGGGALLSGGCYLVSFASMVFGPATSASGLAHFDTAGIDETSAWTQIHDKGRLASFSAAVRTNAPPEVVLFGEKGSIRVHAPFLKATRMTLRLDGQDDKIIEDPVEGRGYHYEAIETMECMSQGRLESDVMPLDESLGIMKTMDELRQQWGLTYPCEK